MLTTHFFLMGLVDNSVTPCVANSPNYTVSGTPKVIFDPAINGRATTLKITCLATSAGSILVWFEGLHPENQWSLQDPGESEYYRLGNRLRRVWIKTEAASATARHKVVSNTEGVPLV